MKLFTFPLVAGLCSIAASAVAMPTVSPRHLVEVVDISSVAISPDGRSVAFREERPSVERNTTDVIWHVAPTSGDRPAARIADGGLVLRDDGGRVVNRPPTWSPDSVWIYFLANVQGEVQVWRAAANGEIAEQLTRDAADVIDFVLSGDGSILTYAVGPDREEVIRAELEEYDAGILVNGLRPIGQGLFRSALRNGRRVTQVYSGDDMGRQGLLEDRPRRIRSLDLAGGGGSEPAPVEAGVRELLMNSDVSGLRGYRAEDGARVAIVDYRSAQASIRVEGTREAATQCNDLRCTSDPIEGVAWRPGTEEVLFTTRHRDRGYGQSLHIWDTTTGEVQTLAESQGLLSGDRLGLASTCAVGADVAACVTASARVPPKLEAFDLASGESRTLHAPNLGLEKTPTRHEFLTWAAEDGRHFTGDLFLPPEGSTEGPVPLFITYYACVGFLRGGLGDEWPLESLAAAGIATLCINRAPRPDAGPDRLADMKVARAGIESAIDNLVDRGLVDRGRVGMGGFSMGAEITMFMAAQTNKLAAISLASTSISPTYYWFHALQPGFDDRLMTTWHVGPPTEDSERWRIFSPVFHASEVEIPVLFQLSEQEYLSTVQYYSQFVMQGTPAELFAFPDEPHTKYQPRHKLSVYERNLDWFRFWLQGYVDPAPRKREQYRRWQAFRVQP